MSDTWSFILLSGIVVGGIIAYDYYVKSVADDTEYDDDDDGGGGEGAGTTEEEEEEEEEENEEEEEEEEEYSTMSCDEWCDYQISLNPTVCGTTEKYEDYCFQVVNFGRGFDESGRPESVGDGCLNSWQVRIFKLEGDYSDNCATLYVNSDGFTTEEAAKLDAINWVDNVGGMGAEENVFIASSLNYMVW